jgi:hypothetical protein
MGTNRNVAAPSTPSTVLVVLGIVALLAAIPASAQVVIPAGSTIDDATLTVVALYASGQTVDVYRVTADWGESSVTWNSFAGAYDPVVVGTFSGTYGANSVDVTPLVQAWVDGTAPNFGVLLKQLEVNTIAYHSSDNDPAYIYDRPKLEVCYTTPAGVSDCVAIQRPGSAQAGVADAYIHEAVPNTNGNTDRLFTGVYNGFEKSSLVRFSIIVEQEAPGTGTPGYWENHPGAWPVDAITIGGVTYTKAEAIGEMGQPIRGDKTRNMFNSLVAAKLNVMIGNDDSCIGDEIVLADDWLTLYPLGSGVKAGGSGSPWRDGESIHLLLDRYNNGLLGCADARH